MFQKFNPITNRLSPSDQISALRPEGLGTKEAVNNFFVAPQPKSGASAAAGTQKVATLASSQQAIHDIVTKKAGAATSGHGHGHGSHAEPWEGVNLWRTPFKGDKDTITHQKRTLTMLDQYVENRTRRIQELQLLALRNKSVPTWVMMPRDKLILGVQAAIAGYVLYQLSTTVYQHLKAKDRIKLLKLLYKDNTN